jgi:hypothetical protein
MERVPDGQYRGKPIAAETEEGLRFAQLGLSARKGTKQILVMFEITEKGPYKGAVLPWFGYFTKDSKERTVDVLRLCGFEGQNILDVETQKLSGDVVLSVENSEYDGKTQSRVAWVNDPNYVPGIKLAKLAESDKAELRDALKGVLG